LDYGEGEKNVLTAEQIGFIILPSLATGDSMKRPDAHDWKTTNEVAALLKVTPQTVINLINRGRFPGAYKIDPLSINSAYRIPIGDVEKYIEKQRGKS